MDAGSAATGVAGGAPPATVEMTYCCAEANPAQRSKPATTRTILIAASG
jgi:hypothetical protein